MLSIFKKQSKLVELLTRYNPARQEGVISRIKDRLFPHQAFVRNRRRVITAILLFLLFNTAIYIGVFKDYEYFAQNSKTVQLTTDGLDLSKVRETFSSAYGAQESSPFTPYSYLTIISVILLIALVEYSAIYQAYKHLAWRAHKIALGVLIFVIFQCLYLVPIILLVAAETHAIDSLLVTAQAEVDRAELGIVNETSSDTIAYGLGSAVTKVASASSPVRLLSGDYEQSVAINYLGIQETDTFYRAVILPHTVSVDESFSVPHNVILFPNNNLAVSANTPIDQLEKILSTLALQSIKVSYVSDNFSSIKDPAITFLEESKYNQIENKKVEARKKQFEIYLNTINQSIKDNNKYIVDTEQALSSLKSDKSGYEARVRSMLADCYASYGESECSEPTQIVNQAVSDYDKEIRQVEAYLSEAKSYVPTLSRQYSTAKSSYDQFLAYPITPELQAGLFEPPNSIFIKHIASRDNAVLPSSYYYTLLHELIHYYSYSPRDDTPTFIEEGVTDLLALSVGESSAVSSAKMDGYPQEIKIASRLFEMLGQEQATKLFLAKSKVSWQRELDKVCGSGCYKKLENVGDQLTYTALDDIEARSAILNQALTILE